MLENANRIFLAVSDFGNLKRAADFLCLTPSAVSHAILNMEKEYGFTLFNRARTGLTLTENGKAVKEYIMRIAKDHADLDKYISSVNDMASGVLRVGINLTATILWLPDILKSFKEKFPGIEISIYEGLYRDINKWLNSYEIDIGIASYTKSSKHPFRHLYNDPYVCVAPKDFKPRYGNTVQVDELRDNNLLIHFDAIELECRDFLEANSLKYDNHYIIQDNEALLTLIRSGNGLGLSPYMCCCNFGDSANIYPISPPFLRTIVAYLPNSDFVDPIVEQFYSECEAAVAKYAATVSI